MADKKEEKKLNVLDEVKRLEKIRKARLLSSALVELRKKAKQILILKRETNSLLKEIGLCKSDRKKIVDYINSTIKLTPADKSKIRNESVETKEDFVKEIEKKIKDSPITDQFSYYSLGNTTGTNNLANYCTASNTLSDLNVSIGGQSLKM